MKSFIAYQIVAGLLLWCHCQYSVQHPNICCGWCSTKKEYKDSPFPKQFTTNMSNERPEGDYDVKGWKQVET